MGMKVILLAIVILIIICLSIAFGYGILWLILKKIRKVDLTQLSWYDFKREVQAWKLNITRE